MESTLLEGFNSTKGGRATFFPRLFAFTLDIESMLGLLSFVLLGAPFCFICFRASFDFTCAKCSESLLRVVERTTIINYARVGHFLRLTTFSVCIYASVMTDVMEVDQEDYEVPETSSSDDGIENGM